MLLYHVVNVSDGSTESRMFFILLLSCWRVSGLEARNGWIRKRVWLEWLPLRRVLTVGSSPSLFPFIADQISILSFESIIFCSVAILAENERKKKKKKDFRWSIIFRDCNKLNWTLWPLMCLSRNHKQINSYWLSILRIAHLINNRMFYQLWRVNQCLINDVNGLSSVKSHDLSWVSKLRSSRCV